MHSKVTAAGLLVALGIIFGDIGTSPLYVLNAITSGRVIDRQLILGSLSCIIWTLTLQTTIKYVVLTLQADNKGEGGIFSLFTLVRRRSKKLVIPAMIGGAALLADGMITPPISVTSAVEGLRNIPMLGAIGQGTIIYIVIAILALIFLLQQFGTAFIGKLFGPVMLVWFLMLAALGMLHIGDHTGILHAFDPTYAIDLLTRYPNGFYVLGGVFLCTTGAEALYSDLGHCGRQNIRISWIFVKSCLILNYLGQGAWTLSHRNGEMITDAAIEAGFNPFYAIMPVWFVPIGIAVATTATIIASQALISGSFTLINEVIRLDLWPKLKVQHPTEARGQVYVPAANLMLFIGCVLIVLYFRQASNMEAAYGLAITVTMITTTILFANFLLVRGTRTIFIFLFLLVYLTIEAAFLIANLDKFPHGGFVTILIGGVLFYIMFNWRAACKIKNRYREYVLLKEYVAQLRSLSNNASIPKFATHLVFLTSSKDASQIEHKIIHSILVNKPKRADIYWFVHVRTMNEPYTMEYKVVHIAENDVVRVEFRLGFRVQPRLNIFFPIVVEELVKNREVDISGRLDSSTRSKDMIGDFTFVVMEKYLSHDNELSLFEKIIMRTHYLIKKFSLSESRVFGLDSSHVVVEKFPLIVSPPEEVILNRIDRSEISRP